MRCASRVSKHIRKATSFSLNAVQPPRGKGAIRLLEIENVDLQPCGGTHVGTTSEVGAVRLGKVENKGRQNRRVNIHLDD